MDKWIYNADSVTHTYQGQDIASETYYKINAIEEIKFANDSALLTDIGNADAIISKTNDSSGHIATVVDQITFLMNDTPRKVQPTAPSNDYTLKPFGMVHKHVNSSSLIHDITLSNKTGKVFNYSCTETPEYMDCICNSTSEERDGILSVDTQAGTLETFNGVLSNTTYHLCEPVDIDYVLPSDEYDMMQLWGLFFSATDFGEDDAIRIQICDTTGRGVALGWYTQGEFEAMGSFYLVKEYDECWVRQISEICAVSTPDGSPGELPTGLTVRVKYYPKDVAKTDIKVWIDYKLTILG